MPRTPRGPPFPRGGGTSSKVAGWDMQGRRGGSLLTSSGLLQDKAPSTPLPHLSMPVRTKGLCPVSSARSFNLLPRRGTV